MASKLLPIATGCPVVAFTVLIALGEKRTGTAFNKISAPEKWAERITAVASILVGICYSPVYVFVLRV